MSGRWLTRPSRTMCGVPRQTERTSGRTGRERNSTADRALDVLALFDEDTLMLSGQEVASRLGVARSTAYRYLQSLVNARFLEEQSRVGFRLGPRVFELARLARMGLGLSEISLPVMEELSAELGHTVLLTKRSASTVVCVERVSAKGAVQLSYERGQVLPINAGASALVLLAWLPEDEVHRIAAEGLPRLTEQTVTDLPALLKRLQSIREQGYAVSRGELDPDVLGVAAPIVSGVGHVAAALSVTLLSHRTPDDEVPALADAVLAAARQIGERLALTAA